MQAMMFKWSTTKLAKFQTSRSQMHATTNPLAALHDNAMEA
jgi:hypothetical protein